MNFTHALSLAVLPEAILVGVAAISAMVAFVRPGLRPDIHRWIACIGLLGSLAACGLILLGLRHMRPGIAISVWNGGFVIDSFALFTAILACVTALCTCLISDTAVRRIPSRMSAFYALILVATAAVEAIAAQREMITFFIALVLLVLCLVALGALVKTDPRGGVSSFEHLVEGMVAAACVLYGLVLLYGVTGTSNLSAVAHAVGAAPGAIALGVALVLLGLCSTLGIFPLRRWVGRVASSVPAGAAGFILAMSLIGGGAALARVTVSGLGPGVGIWRWHRADHRGGGPRSRIAECPARDRPVATLRTAGQRPGRDVAPRSARVHDRIAGAARVRDHRVPGRSRDHRNRHRGCLRRARHAAGRGPR